MRIAYYAPLKPPGHPVPSGDRRMARLVMAALAGAGHEVELASSLRAWDGEGSPERQEEIRAEAAKVAAGLLERWRAAAPAERPAAWLTYHLYHKAPDWLGPTVSHGLGIPYLVAEASLAPRRANGAWAVGHAAAERALGSADAVLAITREDAECLSAAVASPERLLALAPFLDAAPFRAAHNGRHAHRARIADRLGIDPGVPWLLTVAMMRHGDKLASYRRLAAALGMIGDLGWRLVVVGDGAVRAEVARVLADAAPGRAVFAGVLDEGSLPAFYAAADVYAWPAVNEAWGMAFLEAQAAGLPVVAGLVRGVPDVVRHGESGLLVAAGDDDAFAAALRRLILDRGLRARLGAGASAHIAANHDIAAGSAALDNALAVAAGAAHGRAGVAQ